MIPPPSTRLAPVLLPLAAALAVFGLFDTRFGAANLAAQFPTRNARDAAVRYVPAELQDTSWLQRLRDAQLKAATSVTAFHDFHFTDRLADSGITFRHHIVDDAGKAYKAVHYDHGNGIAVADVDGDGRLDLYLVSQTGGNELWRNAGGGKFENITSSAGVGVPGKISVSATFADLDNDGDEDLYVTTVRGGNVLFENDGRGRFRDISAASGLGYVGHSSSALFFDYDHDGLLDLFLVNVGKYTTDTLSTGPDKYYIGFDDAFSGHLKPERTEPSLLFHNDGRNHFADVSQRMGVQDTSWSGDAAAIDVNDDGWVDLYVLNMEGDDQYYENAGGTRFVKKSREVFPKTSWGAMGIKAFDYDNDGRLDIFITDMHSDMSDMTGPEHDHDKSTIKWPESFRGNGSTSIWGNSFFQKDGPDQFHETSSALGLESYCPWGPSVGDLNADGYQDAFIASGMNYPFRYMVNAVKLNDRGTRFVDAEFTLGVEPRAGGVAQPWFELDASGKDKGHPDAAGATGRVAVWGAKGSRSAAIFDVDGDGDLDIVTNEFNASPMVLVSDLSEKTRVHYVQVKLAGTTSNRDGLGAIVQVTAGGKTYTQAMDGSSGYLSHSVMPLYFGLGAAESVDRLEVRWPSGKKQTIAAPIGIDSTILVKES